MAKTDGTVMGVYINGTSDSGTLIGASTSASLEMGVDTFEVSSKDSAGHKEILPGKSNWSVSGDFIDDIGGANYEFADFYALVQSKAEVWIRIQNSTPAATVYYQGKAYLTSVSRAHPDSDAVTGSYSFEGTAALQEKTYT